MFEGKHIHFSPTDNKPLCSYSGKLCRQRRLNGYAFCIRHILEDKSAPFKQCSYVTRNNSQKCLNAIPTSQDRGYCHSHMQVVGIIPKTERKSKTVAKAESLSSGSEKSLTSPPTPQSTYGKKDPGAVFKFEEDSSDTADVHFTYKNGLTSNSNGNATLTNGKGKGQGSKGSKDTTSTYSTKIANGFTGSFTTKKITDKNKNVYTAIIPTTNCIANNNNNNQTKTQNNDKKASWSPSSTDTKKSFSSIALNSESSLKSNQKDSFYSREGGGQSGGGESKLNKVQHVEEIRQFEQLKTLKLKQLDRSMLATSNSISKENPRTFPRLASANVNSKFGSIPRNGNSVSPPQSPSSPISSGNRVKAEIVSKNNPPGPALITRCDRGIIIKTENHFHTEENVKYEKNQVNDKDAVNIPNNNNNNNNVNGTCSKSNVHCNSIDDTQDDSRNRHQFLAQVRNTFRSQYKSIKKSSKVSEKCERNDKEMFRESLMKCVKIDSSICAQVLLGYGLRLPVFSGAANAKKEAEATNNAKKEFDDYEFFDTESLSPSSRLSTANFNDHSNTKSKGNGMKKNVCNGNIWKSNGESKGIKVYQRKYGGMRNNEKDAEKMNGTTEKNNKHAHEDNSAKLTKNGKKVEKGRLLEVTKEQKTKHQTTPPSKRRLKHTDVLPQSAESSVGSGSDLIKEEVMGSPQSGTAASPENSGKKRRLGLSSIVLDQSSSASPPSTGVASSTFDVGNAPSAESPLINIKTEKDCGKSNAAGSSQHELNDILNHSQGHSSSSSSASSSSSRRNRGLETVLNSVGSSENAATPDGVITDASFDSTFEHSTSSQQDCEFSEDDLEHSFELQIDPEIESQASRLLEDNVLTEADFTELFPDNRMSDHKFGRSDLQELGMGGLEFDVNDIDYSLFANIFPNFSRSTGGQPESISISNQF